MEPLLISHGQFNTQACERYAICALQGRAVASRRVRVSPPGPALQNPPGARLSWTLRRGTVRSGVSASRCPGVDLLRVEITQRGVTSRELGPPPRTAGHAQTPGVVHHDTRVLIPPPCYIFESHSPIQIDPRRTLSSNNGYEPGIYVGGNEVEYPLPIDRRSQASYTDWTLPCILGTATSMHTDG